MAPARGSANPLLASTEIGKARKPVVNLPPGDHVYGKKSADSGGVTTKVILTDWQMHQPNSEDLPGRNFRALNRLGIVAGCGTTSKDVAEFRTSHNVLLNNKSTSDFGKPVIEDGYAHGTKNRPSTPMGKLVRNEYMSEFESEQAEKMKEHKLKVAKLPITHTRASLGHMHADPPPQPEGTKTFKMKRFQNVKSKWKQDMSP